MYVRNKNAKYSANIQGIPTPVIYVIRVAQDIFLVFHSRHSISLSAAELRDVVVPVGSFQGQTLHDIALSGAELRDVIQPVGTFQMGETYHGIALSASELRDILVDVGSFTMGNTAHDISLSAALLDTVLIPVGTYTNETQHTISLGSASLA